MRRSESVTIFTIGVLAGLVTGVAAQSPSPPVAQVQNRLERFGERDAQPNRATLAIVGGMLIDGHEGPPRHHSVVLVDGNRIVATGTRDTLTVPPGTPVVEAYGMTVMPGLIDAHMHLDIQGDTNYTRWHDRFGLTKEKWERTMAVTARQHVMSGVTSALDLSGSPEALIGTKRKIDSGEIPGPRMKLSMGQIVNWGPDLGGFSTAGRDSFSWNVKTVEEARAAALKVIEYGADVIKVQNGLRPDQIQVIAEEARKHGLRLTGHVNGKAGLIASVTAGQNGVEHFFSTGFDGDLDPDVRKVLLDHRAAVTPTLIQSMSQLRVLENPDYFVNNPRMKALTPPDMWQVLSGSLEHPERLVYFGQGARYRTFREWKSRFKQLWDSGIRVNVGTDAGTVLNLPTEAMWQEMDLMVEFGAPPMEVIGAATRRNAEWIGWEEQLGTVTAGKLADLIVVDGNPLKTMRDLRHVVVVIKDGKVLKGPTPSPTARPRGDGR
ncbi:MAG: amidohydrolase family protein [Vicinamibacterales bacterium]